MCEAHLLSSKALSLTHDSQFIISGTHFPPLAVSLSMTLRLGSWGARDRTPMVSIVANARG